MARAHEATHGENGVGENGSGTMRPGLVTAPLAAVPPAAARSRRGLIYGALLTGTLALAGCAGGDALDGVSDGSLSGAVGGVQNTQPAAAMTVGTGPDALTYDCPSVTVRTGAATFQSKDGQGGLRYQANIGQLARECAIVGNQMTAKVGIEGRVLLGEAGSPGTINVPIRVAVVEEGPSPRTLTTKLFNVAVDVPAGENQAPFTVVEDQISFPLKASPSEMDRYVIYVGYDPQGQKPQTRSRPAQRQQRPAVARPRPAETSTPSTSSAPPPMTAPATTIAPSSDVFGPPPSSGTSSGGFTAPPSSSAFEPPPAASTN